MKDRQSINPVRFIRFAGEVSATTGKNDILLETATRDLCVTNPSRSERQAIATLQNWSAGDLLFAAAIRSGGPTSALALHALLNDCVDAGLIEEGLKGDEGMVFTVRLRPGTGLGTSRGILISDPPFVFARNVQLIPGLSSWKIASPTAPGMATIHHSDAVTAIAGTMTGWWPDGALESEMAQMLLKAELLVSAKTPEPECPLPLHDLWLHTLSRRGTAPGPVGAVRRTRPEKIDAQESSTDGAIALPVPTTAADISFDSVLSQRASVRNWRANTSICAEKLGALLWMTSRDVRPATFGTDEVPRVFRPYPSAGGRGTCDLYIALADPRPGLPGFARYDPAKHALIPTGADPLCLFKDAAESMGAAALPPGLIVLVARFDRVACTYGDASYALILKDAGVILQTLHLSATALGLGSCILGGGNSRDFADITGLDPLVESPVGEIALTGRLADNDTKEGKTDV